MCFGLGYFCQRFSERGENSDNSIFLDFMNAREPATDIGTITGCPSTYLYKISLFPEVVMSWMTDFLSIAEIAICPFMYRGLLDRGYYINKEIFVACFS